jgi:hypothetical protein
LLQKCKFFETFNQFSAILGKHVFHFHQIHLKYLSKGTDPKKSKKKKLPLKISKLSIPFSSIAGKKCISLSSKTSHLPGWLKGLTYFTVVAIFGLLDSATMVSPNRFHPTPHLVLLGKFGHKRNFKNTPPKCNQVMGTTLQLWTEREREGWSRRRVRIQVHCMQSCRREGVRFCGTSESEVERVLTNLCKAVLLESYPPANSP